MGFLDELFKVYKSPELDESNSALKPESVDWQDLYNKYNSGYSPKEQETIAKEMNAPVSFNEQGQIASSMPVQQPNLMNLVRQQAGMPAEPEIGKPNLELFKALTAPKVELAGKPERMEPKPPALAAPITQQTAKPKEDYIEQLKATQGATGENRLGTGILRGTNKIGAAIAGVKPDYSGVDALEKTVGEPTHILQEKIGVQQHQNKLHDEQEMNDAGSPTSQMLRQFSARFGMKLPDNVSGKQIATIMPTLVQAYEAEENRKARLAMAKETADAKKEASAEKKSEKTDTDTRKRFDTMGQKVTAEIASGRTSFGQDAQAIRTVENAQALLHGGKNLNDLDARQVYEAARVLDRLLSGGVGSIKSSSKLTPESAMSWMNETLEKVTNQRRGAGLGSFMKNMDETFTREKAIAQKRLQKSQRKILSSYKDLKEKDPEKWDLIMAQHGLPTDPFSDESSDTIKVQTSDGQMHQLPKSNLEKAKQRDPGLKVLE